MDIDVRTQQGVVRGRMDEGVATFKGAFSNGSGVIPQYEGSRFARDGVICVLMS